MKKFTFTFMMLLAFSAVFPAQQTRLSQLFEKYQDTEGVTSIKIAKPMFSMLKKLNLKDSELDKIQPLLSKINGLQILIVEKPAETASAKEKNALSLLGSEIASGVKNLNYQELMTVNAKGNKIKFMAANSAADVLDNLLLSVSAEENTILMMLDGKVSMDDISKLLNEDEAPETLKK